MSRILRILEIVNENVNDFTVSKKPNFTQPKIYTGGIDISKWSKYSKAEQEKALGEKLVRVLLLSQPQNQPPGKTTLHKRRSQLLPLQRTAHGNPGNLQKKPPPAFKRWFQPLRHPRIQKR